MSDVEKLRDAVAKNLYERHAQSRPESIYGYSARWHELGPGSQILWRDQAATAFRVIDAAGFAVVPKVATEEMARSGAAQLRNYMTVAAPYPRTRAMYDAMLAAAPKVLP